MLTNIALLKGFTILATDGELGTTEDFYFDDESWAVRYLTVETGGWLGGRQVLISPVSIIRTDWQEKRVEVSLTKKQVENSPAITTHQPVSRQHETEYLGYYGYPNYWDGPYLWGPALSPTPLIAPSDPLMPKTKNETADSHLRSAKDVTGYRIEAEDGEIGHLDGFLMDAEVWAIRYIEVATRNWWPGKKVLISPSWIKQVSWLESKVSVALHRETIQAAPEYSESLPITREYEDRLYLHYGQARYWLHEGRFK